MTSLPFQNLVKFIVLIKIHSPITLFLSLVSLSSYTPAAASIPSTKPLRFAVSSSRPFLLPTAASSPNPTRFHSPSHAPQPPEMAAAAAAAAPAPSSSEIANEGPVLNLINKRLRAMRKKLNRIAQMEESVAQGKVLNKEQEETLRSKPYVVAGIDELEKLRQPLLNAVDQEIELALAKKSQKADSSAAEISSDGDAAPEAEEKAAPSEDASAVSDLLNLLYFGSIFDVKTLMRANDNMLTRTHERNCCLTYDYVTDDDAAGDPLKEWDLDVIAMLGGSLISRPVNSSLSHKESLQKCVEHAKLWLANADQPIDPSSDITCMYTLQWLCQHLILILLHLWTICISSLIVLFNACLFI